MRNLPIANNYASWIDPRKTRLIARIHNEEFSGMQETGKRMPRLDQVPTNAAPVAEGIFPLAQNSSIS
jgi:hypothetical protein